MPVNNGTAHTRKLTCKRERSYACVHVHTCMQRMYQRSLYSVMASAPYPHHLSRKRESPLSFVCTQSCLCTNTHIRTHTHTLSPTKSSVVSVQCLVTHHVTIHTQYLFTLHRPYHLCSHTVQCVASMLKVVQSCRYRIRGTGAVVWFWGCK